MRKKRLLVAYSANSTFVATTRDYLDAFRRYSDWDVYYLHVTDSANVNFDFACFDAVFHNYCARLCFDGYVSGSYLKALRRFQGVKILAVQDEYDFTDKVRRAAVDLEFDVFLTCVPEESWDFVYPRAMFPKTKFVQVLTGYVPGALADRGRAAKPPGDRPILIGYRGRDIGGRYGRLGHEKLEIGSRMLDICEARGLPVDIAFTEEARIYGHAWFDFLGSCRATLASESGSNIFDFDGVVASDFAVMTKQLGRPPSYQQFEPRIRALENAISMGQVSPRVFEAATMRTALVMFEGRYSGVVEPDRHYIELRKDFSNVDSVLAKLADIPSIVAMTDRAFHDLVGSGRYSYRAFVATVLAAADKRQDLQTLDDTVGDVPLGRDLSLGWRPSGTELPTREPLSRDWYLADAWHRTNQASAGEVAKLLIWARRAIASQALASARSKLEALVEIENQSQDVTETFLNVVRRANEQRDGKIIEHAAAKAKIAHNDLMRLIASIVLDGQSPVATAVTALRAPWVDADIQTLYWAKKIRERAAARPFLRRTWKALQRLAPPRLR